MVEATTKNFDDYLSKRKEKKKMQIQSVDEIKEGEVLNEDLDYLMEEFDLTDKMDKKESVAASKLFDSDEDSEEKRKKREKLNKLFASDEEQSEIEKGEKQIPNQYPSQKNGSKVISTFSDSDEEEEYGEG